MRTAHVLAILGTAIAFYGQPKPPKGAEVWHEYAYYPAMISSSGGFPPRVEVMVFPFRGKSFTISLELLPALAFSPEGRAVYGVCKTESNVPITLTLCKIDLSTSKATVLEGSVGLSAGDLAVSRREDHILVSGGHQDKRDHGLFELTIPGGSVRPVLVEPQRSPRSFWMHLSLSPDGKRAVATHEGQLKLIDVVKGTVENLGDAFFLATWSPDGRWLAVLENGEHGRAILLDATTMIRKRVLGNSNLDWSPDSRYLLGMKERAGCGPYNGTLQTINVETGERTTIKSSECQVNRATTGWVSRDVPAR